MKNSTTDQVKGKFNKVTGKIKEGAGSLLGNPELEAEGKDQNRTGHVQEKVGQVKKVIGK
jgi:uncharacterized protein YjbJ (UPF0337 family)